MIIILLKKENSNNILGSQSSSRYIYIYIYIYTYIYICIYDEAQKAETVLSAVRYSSSV